LRQKWGCQVMQWIFGCPIWSSFLHPTASFWRSLDCFVVRFYFSIFSSLGSFQQSPSDVQLMPANELCLPARLAHTVCVEDDGACDCWVCVFSWVLKRAEQCGIRVHFLNKVPLSLHLQILCSRLGASSLCFVFLRVAVRT
jgi:hypothetical protein